jgi:hypothetical protein
MSVLDILHEESRRFPIRKQIVARHVYPTVSGTEGSRIGAGFTLWVGMPTGGVGETALVKYDAVYTGMAFVVSCYEDYGKFEPEMVARLLRLDAETPEAKFNNVIDMMDWLNSD